MSLIRVGGVRAAAAGYVERLADRLGERAASAAGRRSAGFNCCESCSEALRRHPDHLWRYDEVCTSCGHIQSWASGADPSSI